jgi:hypothetical protein
MTKKLPNENLIKKCKEDLVRDPKAECGFASLLDKSFIFVE